MDFSRGRAVRLVPSVRTPQGRPRCAFRALGEALCTRDLARAHRVVERTRARPARLALRVEATAAGERESATAGAAAAVRDAKEPLALGAGQRGQVQVRDVVHPRLLL